MKLKLKISIPSDEFPDDIFIETDNFYYFVFETAIEIWPAYSFPTGMTQVGFYNLNVDRRTVFKLINDYTRSVRAIEEFDKLNTAYD